MATDKKDNDDSTESQDTEVKGVPIDEIWQDEESDRLLEDILTPTSKVSEPTE